MAVVDRGGDGPAPVRPRPAARVARAGPAAGEHRQHRRRRAAVRRALEAARGGGRREAHRAQLGDDPVQGGGRAAALSHRRGGAVRHPRRRGRARAVGPARPEARVSGQPGRGAPGAAGQRGLAAGRDPRPALVPGGRAGAHVPRVRDAGHERRLLVPALEQGVLPGDRRDRPSRAARLLRREPG